MLSDKVFRFNFEEDVPINHRFLDYVLKSPALRKQIQKGSTGTSPTMKNISKEKVLNLLIPSKDMQEQMRIAFILDDLQSKLDALKRHQAETSAKLDSLMPSILDKAFNGEL
jgi:type I restriction enzyme S subunit